MLKDAVRFRFEGSDESRAEFISAMRAFPGVKAEEWIERMNAEGEGIPPYVVIMGALKPVKDALVAYLKSRRKEVLFYPDGAMKKAVNYSAKDIQKMRTLPALIVAQDDTTKSGEEPGVIRGFARPESKDSEPN